MPDHDHEITFIIQQAFKQSEKIAPTVGPGVIPIWRDSNIGGRVLVGSAFFMEWEKRSFLVTALHNFTENPGVILKIELSGTIWTLNDMPKRVSAEDDLWLSEIEVGLQENIRDISVPTLKSDDPQRYRFSFGVVLIGYPDELNSQGAPFKALPISTILEFRELTTPTKLPEPIVYNVDGDFFSAVDGSSKIDRPDISGMSGGPVYGWYFTTRSDCKGWKLHYHLQGMIVSWKKKEGYVVACNAARIVTLVTTT